MIAASAGHRLFETSSFSLRWEKYDTSAGQSMETTPNARDTSAAESPLQAKLKSKCCFTSTETVGLLGTEAQDVHLNFHAASEL